MAGMFVFKQGVLSPALVTTVNYQLLKNLNGRITYAMGFKSKMVTALQYEKDGYQIELSVHLSIKNSQLALEVSKAFLENTIVLKSSAKLGSYGYILDFGINKKITEFTNAGASILFGNRIGVFLNIRFDRASQSFIFPIHLSTELVPSAIFYGALAPICVYYVAKKMIIDPYIKEKTEK
jgi:DnaJ homolog subfamily C member 11